MWITYHALNGIPILQVLGNIHWNYNYSPVDDNIILETFSKEKYDEITNGIEPAKRDFKYYVASWTINHGDCIFGNYSRYEQTCHLLSFHRPDEAMIEYHKLPKFYQSLVREIHDDLEWYAVVVYHKCYEAIESC